MSKKIYYCGPYWLEKLGPLGRFLRKYISKYFNESCELHDRDYDNKIGIKEADRLFLRRMLETTTKFNLAILVYYLVRIGGWASYYKDDIKNGISRIFHKK